jgi:hypothetical protein
LPAFSIDVPLEEDSKEELSDSSNANNNNANHSSAQTTLIREEDKQTPHHDLNTTCPMHHDRIIMSLSQSQLILIEPMHPHGVVEDEDADSPEVKPHKPLNQDTYPRAQDK